MRKNSVHAQIERLISRGETEEAISAVQKYCQKKNNRTLLNRAAIISANFISAKKSWQDGTATLQEFHLVQARTNEALLDLFAEEPEIIPRPYIALVTLVVLAVLTSSIMYYMAFGKDSIKASTISPGTISDADRAAQTVEQSLNQDFGQPKIKDETAIRKNKIERKTFFIDSAQKEDIIQLIERGTGYKYDKNSKSVISISYSGEILPTNAGKNLFRYSGGKMLILINGQNCHTSAPYFIERTLPSGNSLDFVKNEILNQINNILERDSTAIVNCIRLCID